MMTVATSERAAKRLRQQLEPRARRLAADHNSVAAWDSQLRKYRELLDHKRIALWSDMVEALQHNPRRMWQVIDDLLGQVNCITGNTSLTAEHVFQFFDANVSGVKAATATSPKPLFSVAPTSCRLQQFAEISEQEVIKAVMSLNNKQCDFDLLPTWLQSKKEKH